jgi:hypothetical protein
VNRQTEARQIRGLALGLVVAILTFIVGVASSTVWIIRHVRRDGTAKLLRAGTSRAGTEESWQIVDMEGRFTFELPPEMKEITPNGEYSGYVQEFSGGNIRISAGYSESGTCGLMPNAETSRIAIDGKEATLSVIHSYEPKLTLASICLREKSTPKTKIWISTSYTNPDELAIVNRIFSSVGVQ